jgi:predicted enzyme related to lactoylglutathione lyase
MVEVRARDWERLCAFYGVTLGLPRRMLDVPGRFAMYGAREPFVAVVGRRAGGTGASRVVMDFAVADLGAALHALAARGVRPSSGPEESAEGYRLARIEDPEGNEIHLFEWTAPGGPG